MARVPITPPPGLFSDETSNSTPGLWADGSNVRFWQGRPQVIGGWSRAVTGIQGVCRNALAWIDNSGRLNIAFGTHSHLMLFRDGALYDITPVGLNDGAIDGAGGPGYGTGNYGEGPYGESPLVNWYARTWSLDTYGEWLVACPRGGTIYGWKNDTGAVAEPWDGAPEQINSILVTPERQILCFGCSEETSGDFNGMAIRGSDILDPNDFTTSSSNNAFEHILEGGGRIVGAKMQGSFVAVWADTSVHLGQFIGELGQAYRFDLVASNCGLAGPNGVAVVNQTAYWVTPDFQIYAWQVGTPPTPLKCTIREDFKNNIPETQPEKIVACSVSPFNEIWFFYPDQRDGNENSRYIAVSTLDGAWFRGVIARTAAIDSGPTAYPLYVAYDGTAYWHENGNTADGGQIAAHLTTSDFYLNEAESWVMIRGIWPDFKDQVGPVSLMLTCRDYPASANVFTKGPYTLEAGRSKRDFLASARLTSFTLSSNSAPSYWRLGKPSFDVVQTGQQ